MLYYIVAVASLYTVMLRVVTTSGRYMYYVIVWQRGSRFVWRWRGVQNQISFTVTSPENHLTCSFDIGLKRLPGRPSQPLIKSRLSEALEVSLQAVKLVNQSLKLITDKPQPAEIFGGGQMIVTCFN